jgi:hypothetical protein
MADEASNRRDILMTAKGLRAVRDHLSDFMQALRDNDGQRVGELFVAIRDGAESAENAIRRVAVDMFPEIYDDSGRLREITVENWPWHMPERPRG